MGPFGEASLKSCRCTSCHVLAKTSRTVEKGGWMPWKREQPLSSLPLWLPDSLGPNLQTSALYSCDVGLPLP